MKQLLAFLLICCSGVALAQPANSSEMEYVDSLILAQHHYDLRVVKKDTAYTHNSIKITEHYFIDTTTHTLERAVRQVFHTPNNSTIEYYFFVNNALARVQSQQYKDEQFGDAEIYYFQNNTPLDCRKKVKGICEQYVRKARVMVSSVLPGGS